MTPSIFDNLAHEARPSSFDGFEWLDLRRAIEQQPAPPEGYKWQFLADRPTWLQTNSICDGDARWYLTHRQGDAGDDPAYYIEIEPTAQCVLNVLAQVADKAWTDKAQLLEAILPAIRAIAWKG